MVLWFFAPHTKLSETYTTLDKIEPTHALGANIVSELIPSTGMGDNTLFHDEKWRVVEGASSIPNLLHINLKALHLALHIPNMIEQRLYLGVSKKGINNRDKFSTAAFATGQQQHDDCRAEGWGKLVADKFDAVAAYRDQHRSCGREPSPKRLKPTPPTYAPPTHLTEAKIEVDATVDHSSSAEKRVSFISSLRKKAPAYVEREGRLG